MSITELYKSRREIEMSFKGIKQNMKNRAVLGGSINAVPSKIFGAMRVDRPMAYLKFVSQSAFSMQAMLRLLQAALFIRRSIGNSFYKLSAGSTDSQPLL